ncbi:MAG: hypothetical protein HUU17_04115 [Chthonomonadales bacterium]|nr:hypothetical protein [Chthonomonadales bacterium]
MSRRICLIVAVGIALSIRANADRIVRAPSGRITLPGHLTARYLMPTIGSRTSARLNIGVPKDDLGLEMEVEALRPQRVTRTALNLHYSVISEAFTNNLAPSVAVGIQDVLNTGASGRAAYLALSKTIPLSEAMETHLGTLRLHAGYGSRSMDGGWIGATVVTRYRIAVSAEYYRRRPAYSAQIDLVGPLQAYAYRYDDTTYLGLGITLGR